MPQSREEQLKVQRQAMERQRFGYTRDEIIAAKGATCYICHQPVDPNSEDTVISHIHGGGRHASETGMIVPGKTHNMDNLGVAHRACDGKKDRIRNSVGMGIEGNSNNPSQ